MPTAAQVRIMIMPSATLGGENHIYQAYYGKLFLTSLVSDKEQDEVIPLVFTEAVGLLMGRGKMRIAKKPFIDRRGDAGYKLYEQDIEV